MAYSLDLREKVIKACDHGMTTKEVAEMFRVSASWVRRLKQWRRERGSTDPRPCGGSDPKLGAKENTAIHAHFLSHPDTTITELKVALQTEVSEVTVWRAARRLGYRFKKKQATQRSEIAPTSCLRKPSRPSRRARSASSSPRKIRHDRVA